MRKFLDNLYRLSGALAALFLVAIGAIVLLQVALNVVDEMVRWVTGAPIGLVIPSYAEFAGFFLAASSFFALAFTLRGGAHIRVSLVIQRITGRRRRAIELWCVFIGFCLSIYFSYYMIGLVIESAAFGDKSIGIVPVPLWIPQLPLALGLVVLTIAFADEYFSILRGQEPTYESTGDQVLE